MKKIAIAIMAGMLCSILTYAQHAASNTILLNGTWQIAEGKKDIVPVKFDHTIQVPGLVTLAVPSFRDVGPKVKDRGSLSQTDTLRAAFWYRREFTIEGPVSATAVLKISKAKYGTKVFLNGKNAGEHSPCFTPGYFNVKNFLKPGKNELLVCVGSCRDAVSDSIPNGLDFEKERYIPGIYDNVALILSGNPKIDYLQAIPDIVHKQLQVQLTVKNFDTVKTSTMTFTIKESKSAKVVGALRKEEGLSDSETIINAKIPINDCHLWSPEDPFLYTLEVTTEGDKKQVSFGMREFHFDALTHRAVLNGKPYFMRGSNITLYRFFEDTACKNLPWETSWVRSLFRSFKKFHWNSLRFCIGLPPELWYKVADEEGFLIQDEFPIWYGGIGWNTWPGKLKTPELVTEYTEWIHEDWNHPCVVIWDASNETVCNNGQSDETGDAVWQVRSLDLSNRPWDNSYSYHRAPGDVFEAHPYHFQDSSVKLKDLATASVIPQGNQFNNTENYPVIINEYGWLWLNRDGTPTTLTKGLYQNLLGKNSTITERRHLYASYMAAETEFWRCHRKSAGVLIFTALGYSRSDGQTSDFFKDPKKLEYDTEFMKYLPDAFSPVALMLDEWGNNIEADKPHNFHILTINDFAEGWNGNIHLQILQDDKVIKEVSSNLVIPGYGQKAITFLCETPKTPGKYIVIASLEKKNERSVKSVREILFK